MVMVFSSARSGDGSNRCGAAGTHGERTAGSDIRTSGRTNSPSDDPAMASLPRRGKLTMACLRFPPRSPSPNHPCDVAGNPDSSVLERIKGNGAECILVESPDRFARDLTVQLAGHDFLKREGIALVPTTSPDPCDAPMPRRIPT